MEEILIFGGGGQAKVIIDTIRCQNKYKVAGVITNDKSTTRTECCGFPIYHEDKLPELKIYKGIVALGDNWRRSLEVNNILSKFPSFEFITAIHPSSVIGQDCKIGPGTWVAAGVVINPSCTIGAHCVVNTSSSLDHDCVMKDFSSVAPGAHTGGNVTIYDFTTVSIGAQVIHGITIGAHTVIGAGAVVLESVPERVVAYGVPCRAMHARQIGDKYL
ncbi:MAG: hypothetical protein A2X86_12410 [Bdellovibrionales bacterium GWA2_49_15]|nr:MAG: hypothetical protein A2X86_12410 [Bdellovibrionales bacterium GWA2_49_15]